MNKHSQLCLYLCMVFGGCVADPDLEPDEPAIDTAEQELALPRDHFQRTQFGGSLISQPIDYITEPSSLGTCTLGYRRPAKASVTWTSQGGGFCQFDEWASEDPHDCRAHIIGSTPGGFFGFDCNTRVKEVAESSGSTTPAGLFSYTASATSGALINTVNRPISLTAGRILTIGTCSMIGASFSGDTYLRLVDSTGAEVSQSDDSACGLGSLLMYTAPASGTYTIRAGCFSGGSCSGTVSWTID